MSCKDVCMTADYDSGPEFYNDAIRRAAKDHRCCECRDVIARGQQYENVSGKWDGDFTVYKTCLACVEVRKAFYCGGWMLGVLWEDVEDQLFPAWDEMVAIDCLARLTTPAAIDKMRARYAEYRGEEAPPPSSAVENSPAAPAAPFPIPQENKP